MDNQISFTSNIKFISRNDFNLLPLKRLEQSGNFAGYTRPRFQERVESSVIANEAYTDGIYGCIAGTIIEKNMLMFHLNPVPYLDTPQIIDDYIKNYINATKQDKERLKGLLIGGQILSERSNKLFEYLKNLFTNHKINTSFFEGQYHGRTGVYYSQEKDTYFINAQNRYDRDILTIEELKDHFEKIKISKQDQLFLNGKCGYLQVK